jgi:Spy/CpxP family protein refolding chaperone
MIRFRIAALAPLLLAALAAPAQQPPQPNQAAQTADTAGVPAVAAQMKLLATRLDLTADQQTRIAAVLQTLHDVTVIQVQDVSRPRDERFAQIRSERYKADESIRKVLSSSQNAILDQLEQEPHPEFHGAITSPDSLPAQ